MEWRSMIPDLQYNQGWVLAYLHGRREYNVVCTFLFHTRKPVST